MESIEHQLRAGRAVAFEQDPDEIEFWEQLLEEWERPEFYTLETTPRQGMNTSASPPSSRMKSLWLTPRMEAPYLENLDSVPAASTFPEEPLLTLPRPFADFTRTSDTLQVPIWLDIYDWPAPAER